MAKKKFDPALLEVIARAAHGVVREIKKHLGEVSDSWDHDTLEQRSYFIDLTEDALAGKKISGKYSGVVISVIGCINEEVIGPIKAGK